MVITAVKTAVNDLRSLRVQNPRSNILFIFKFKFDKLKNLNILCIAEKNCTIHVTGYNKLHCLDISDRKGDLLVSFAIKILIHFNTPSDI